jgi:hypothetical protein
MALTIGRRELRLITRDQSAYTTVWVESMISKIGNVGYCLAVFRHEGCGNVGRELFRFTMIFQETQNILN